MKHKYPVHDDYKHIQIGVPMNALFLRFFQRVTRLLYDRQSVGSAMHHYKQTIAAFDGKAIPIEVFSPSGLAQNAPCILFIHGGAFALPATDFHKKLMVAYALGCSAKVVCVDYRLVPNYPYPFGLEDCCSAYQWMVEHAGELAIDLKRVAVCGDSAGGALAASLTHLARDRNLSMPLFQMLIYPALDARQQTDSMKRFIDTPIWNARQNKKMWNLYCKKPEIHPYSSPAQAPSFEGLPQAYIEVNEFDCLRDEAIDYAKELQKAGIEVTLNQTQGTVHGFELNWKSLYTQAIIKRRIEYMQRQFGD